MKLLRDTSRVRLFDDPIRKVLARLFRTKSRTPEEVPRQPAVRILQERLGDRLLVAASNRQPYSHVLSPEGEQVVRHAGGLTTALDPVLRVTRGVWVAAANGDSDRQATDSRDRVLVPPSDPAYLLRRVSIRKEEWEGYYLGASNEMLWPLCHIVHIRPAFRAADWTMYRAVNQRFAQAILEEVEGREAIIWTQDYHLALVPQLLRKARPDLILGHFWHIPWPNPEVFRICPWKTEILEGLLGADVLGFHIRYHCDNFLRTIGQDLEAKIIEEHSTVQYRSHTTKVCPFPISIDFEGIRHDLETPEVRKEGEVLNRLLSARSTILAVGVDRLDYTKGIPERLLAIDLFLQQHPEYQGRFVYLGIAAPSRMDLPAYQELGAAVGAQAQTINDKYATDTWRPILLLNRPVYHPNILAYLARADIAIVSALHDGMNLVAKEFVAAQSSERPGVLILSQFTGAARELTDALQVNPYHLEEFTEVIHQAAVMSITDRRTRLLRLQAWIREHDIYRWAHQALAEMTQVHRYA